MTGWTQGSDAYRILVGKCLGRPPLEKQGDKNMILNPVFAK
jgi:hypothetical protein